MIVAAAKSSCSKCKLLAQSIMMSSEVAVNNTPVNSREVAVNTSQLQTILVQIKLILLHF